MLISSGAYLKILQEIEAIKELFQSLLKGSFQSTFTAMTEMSETGSYYESMRDIKRQNLLHTFGASL